MSKYGAQLRPKTVEQSQAEFDAKVAQFKAEADAKISEFKRQRDARMAELFAKVDKSTEEARIEAEVEKRVAQRLSSKPSYTPTYSGATPTYKESMELVDNLSKGYPALAMAAFKKHLSYYMGTGICYLPEIIKGAIDGNNLEFVDFLLQQSSKLKVDDILKTYESFVKLKGVNGKDPSEYAASLYNYRISSRLKEVEKANESKLKF